MAARRQINELLGRPFELRLADLILEADDGIGVADVKIRLRADLLNRHSERAAQACGEREPLGRVVDLPVLVRVAQQEDRVGLPVGIGKKQIAVRPFDDPARLSIIVLAEDAQVETLRKFELRAFRLRNHLRRIADGFGFERFRQSIGLDNDAPAIRRRGGVGSTSWLCPTKAGERRQRTGVAIRQFFDLHSFSFFGL